MDAFATSVSVCPVLSRVRLPSSHPCLPLSPYESLWWSSQGVRPPAVMLSTGGVSNRWEVTHVTHPPAPWDWAHGCTQGTVISVNWCTGQHRCHDKCTAALAR